MTLRRRLIGRVPIIVACAALAVAGSGITASAAPASTGANGIASLVGQTAGPNGYLAEIRRTEYGIPHILAGDFGSLGYGYGYAFAQDDFCTLAQRVLAIRGQRSEYFGPDTDSGDLLAPSTNLASDAYFTALRQSGTVQKLVDEPAPLGPTAQVRQLVEGYAAGFDAYLAKTGAANLPDPTCRGAAWIGPITPLDLWIDIYDIQQFGGLAPAKQAVVDAAPPTANKPNTPNSTAAPMLPRPSSDAFGSNGWGIGRDATVGKDACCWPTRTSRGSARTGSTRCS